MEKIRKFFKDESGATAVEYALIVALMAAAIVGVVGVLNTPLKEAFSNIGTTLKNQSTPIEAPTPEG